NLANVGGNHRLASLEALHQEQRKSLAAEGAGKHRKIEAAEVARGVVDMAEENHPIERAIDLPQLERARSFANQYQPYRLVPERPHKLDGLDRQTPTFLRNRPRAQKRNEAVFGDTVIASKIR